MTKSHLIFVMNFQVCGTDIPPEDRRFVRLFPDFDDSLLCYDTLDARRAKERKKTEKIKHNQVLLNFVYAVC